MITLWNRVEVFMSFSMNDFNNARGRLRSSGIKYTYKIHSKDSMLLGSPRRSTVNTFFEKPGFDKTYYIYVHKNDEGIAHKAIHSS